MDNLRSVIKILFRYTSANEVLNGNTSFKDINEESFRVLANSYMPHYSNNEILNMYAFLNSEFRWHDNKVRGEEINDEGDNVNVFDAILLFADSVLVEENGMPLCQYEHLLRWREMIVAIDEDLFISAFLAQKDILNGKNRKLFFWPPVIGHNNRELNRLMARGVAENHFHLKGSAPTFHLSWISMMNDVMNPVFKKKFEDFEAGRLSTKIRYHMEDSEDSLYISYLKAALIRFYLFLCLKEDYITIKSKYVLKERIVPYIDANVKDEVLDVISIGGQNYVEIDSVASFVSQEVYKHFKQVLLRQDIEELLKNPLLLLTYLPDINRDIMEKREEYAPGQLDYMLCEKWLVVNYKNHLNEVISGERWFLYELFGKIYRDDKFFGNLDWFYAYLLIKENIRAELIQANGNVGFSNFLLYQNRKEDFIDGTPFEKTYLKMAVKDTILNQHIKKLEARITPKSTSIEYKLAIEKNDNSILDGIEDEKERLELKNRFFYVCHFIKQEDKGMKDICNWGTEYRHYTKRLEVKKQALALSMFRQTYYDIAERIRGIDAASEEIVCRPEVFAQAFRYLKNNSILYKDHLSNEEKVLPDLSVTYHVGEDFLDIVDGLRAIDEAISFLNLRCGDRLGHALALGIDVENWYESKSNRILISQMEYLDNLVWLYAKIRKYRIEGCEDTIRYIEKRYNEYFRIVYLNNMNHTYFESVVENAIKYFDERKIKHNYGNNQCYFSINTYYDSWKLRGDNPEFFRSGFFVLNSRIRDDWDEFGINKIFPENYRIRYNPEAAYLYHVYHYNGAVKKEGDRKIEIKVNPSIIKAVKKIQLRMQYEIAHRGICIETNPSSNALIGTFKRYDKHPILNWYNNGLALNQEELERVPQIQVSINTDDQGVFATYIENEYAYLALALEKVRDENGKLKFNRTMIYQWLDNIRKMGLSQSFESIED